MKSVCQLQDKKSILETKHALLAEKRAEALRANLKKRKEQTAARHTEIDKKESVKE